jgi:16S rRNA (uracil1498-N3)-methyltransferase
MADLHRFFYSGTMAAKSIVTLEPDTAKHIWQVLRMDEGDKLLLTDGKGTVANGEIQYVERHKCNVMVLDTAFEERSNKQLHLCVGFTKNNSRNEWLLEKATELGVASIAPVATERFQRIHIRNDRWGKILQSTILQSQQSYLPELLPMMSLKEAIKHHATVSQKLIAHCIAGEQKSPLHEMLKTNQDAVVLIGPEGDFSPEEVSLCIASGFAPISLGVQRLRTETAAITVAAYFNLLS